MSKTHEEKYEEVLRAIVEMASDTSVPQRDVFVSLNAIKREIGVIMNAMDGGEYRLVFIRSDRGA